MMTAASIAEKLGVSEIIRNYQSIEVIEGDDFPFEFKESEGPIMKKLEMHHHHYAYDMMEPMVPDYQGFVPKGITFIEPRKKE